MGLFQIDKITALTYTPPNSKGSCAVGRAEVVINRQSRKGGIMRKLSVVLSLSLITVGYLSLTGCQIVQSPMLGIIYTEAKYGDFATDHPSATKEGKACGQSILGWVATGDASITAAKAAGGITTVSSIDHSAKNILGIIGEWCTIVKGS